MLPNQQGMKYNPQFVLSLRPAIKNTLIVRKSLFTLALLACGATAAFAQKKQYQVTAIAFYNLENLYDAEDDPKTRDEEFTPTGPYNYTEAVYHQKLHNLATVISKL